MATEVCMSWLHVMKCRSCVRMIYVASYDTVHVVDACQNTCHVSVVTSYYVTHVMAACHEMLVFAYDLYNFM